MASVVPAQTPASVATSRVMMAEIDLIVAGEESRFPDFASFIPSDLATDARIKESHAVGKAAIVVDEHEHVTVLPAPDPSIAQRESERFWREHRAGR